MAIQRNPNKIPSNPKADTQSAKNRVKAVAFFNNKGGVGKTTLVANLASQLTLKMNRRVLVVDADPQCNLTQYLLDDDAFLDAYKADAEPTGIYSVIHPLSIGKGYTQSLPIRSVPKFGLDLVIGDPRLALKEDLLAQDWRDARAGGTRGLRTTFLFLDLIDKARDYDFVFFDMGRVWLPSCSRDTADIPPLRLQREFECGRPSMAEMQCA